MRKQLSRQAPSILYLNNLQKERARENKVYKHHSVRINYYTITIE